MSYYLYRLLYIIVFDINFEWNLRLLVLYDHFFAIYRFVIANLIFLTILIYYIYLTVDRLFMSLSIPLLRFVYLLTLLVP